MELKKLFSKGLITNGYHLPYNPKLKDRAREFRQNPTPAEFKLWSEFLSKCNPRFRRQKQIENYIVDFYCFKLKLVIEVDGEIHNLLDTIEYDNERTSLLESYGLKVIRFSNDEVLNNFDKVCKTISLFFSDSYSAE